MSKLEQRKEAVSDLARAADEELNHLSDVASLFSLPGWRKLCEKWRLDLEVCSAALIALNDENWLALGKIQGRAVALKALLDLERNTFDKIQRLRKQTGR